MRIWSPTTAAAISPGSSSPATRSWSATSVGRTCTPRARTAIEELARTLYRSLHERLLVLPDHLLVYPAHYAGSVCGRGLSAHPTSSIGFERRHNEAVSASSEDEFVEAVLKDMPPVPEHQAEIVAANRSGEPSAAPA